jgi:hypothetical protein
MRGDWKSAEQIEADIKAGESTDQQQLILDLWRRVDELQTKITELEQRLRDSN